MELLRQSFKLRINMVNQDLPPFYFFCLFAFISLTNCFANDSPFYFLPFNIRLYFLEFSRTICYVTRSLVLSVRFSPLLYEFPCCFLHSLSFIGLLSLTLLPSNFLIFQWLSKFLLAMVLIT